MATMITPRRKKPPYICSTHILTSPKKNAINRIQNTVLLELYCTACVKSGAGRSGGGYRRLVKENAEVLLVQPLNRCALRNYKVSRC